MFSFTDARAEDITNSPNKGTQPYAGLVQGSDGNFYGTTYHGGANDLGTVFKMTPVGVLTTLVEFTGNGTSNKGRYPRAGLVQGSDGNFYGTATSGGATGNGTVFKMTPGGVLTTLVEFTGNGTSNKGSQPWSGLLQGSDGNFYGTTYQGGANGFGTVFKMTPAGVLTTLVEFTGNGTSNKGSTSVAGLVQGSDGNFYGTTNRGGANDLGTVFKMTPAGVLTTLVEFTGNGTSNKGRDPTAGLVQGSDGNFYGTTVGGGANGAGTVFKMTPVGMLTTLVEFTGTGNGGGGPRGGLVQGSDGNFYVTTINGGATGKGTVFKMTPAGVLTRLVEFTGNGTSNKGTQPYAGLVQGSDGNFYGTTTSGGATNLGTVFKMTPAGVLTTFVEFTGNGTSNKGTQPYAGLVQGSDGNFYGTTTSGGATNLGTVFKMTPAGVLTTLVEFTGNGTSNKGRYPQAGLVQGSDGNFYGTPRFGGANDFGTVFKMTPAGVLTTLVEFTGNGSSNKGSDPTAGLVQGSDGNFYGTTIVGGATGNGTVFKMTPVGVLTTLVEFTGNGTSNKGRYPAGLVQGSDGNFYGTTQIGGANDIGTVFQMTPVGVLTTLVEFTGNGTSNKGRYPQAGLVQGSDGNFYGTTTSGGATGNGTVFQMTPAGVLTTLVEFTGNGTSNKGSAPETGLVQGSDGDFYGTTFYGGANSLGTVFKMTPGGVLTTLVEFIAGNGSPNAELIRATDGNLYGTTSGGFDGDGTIYRLLFPGAPLVAIANTSPPDSVSAVVQAKVNARGPTTAVTLEYGADGVNFPNIVPITVNLTGYQSVLLGRTLSGLIPGTIYFYRFTATSSAGTTVSPVASFSTLAPATATVSAASNVLPTSAQFNGTVNARNYAATVVFEWGTDGNTFPNQAPAVPGTVTGNTNTAVSRAVAGLVKGTTYFYRIIATNAADETVSGTQSFTTLTDPVATVGAATAVTSQSATLNGTVNALGALTSVVFEYGTVPGSYPNSVGATPATVNGNVPVPVSVTLSGLTQGATYYYRVKGTSLGGIGVSAVGTFAPDILSGFAQTFPGAPPSAQGFVLVNLTPVGIASGWRFVGEQLWRAPGVPVSGLTTGDRTVEFRPVPGYIQPPPELVSVISGGLATLLSREYYQTDSGGSGELTVILKPDALADGGVAQPARAQWRFLGEGDPTAPGDDASPTWRDSGALVTGLVPGNYLVECKPVAGRTTPPPLNVPVSDGGTSAPTATYFLADAPAGTLPGVLPFETVTTSANLPYAYVGQIRSAVGVSTGFVVKARVVATAAHVVFDDGTLSYTAGLQWLFQRDRGTFEPTPMLPTGAYLFSGYAAQRTAEATPGSSSPQSQHLDAAALYFLADAARGGFGGYLASDALDNEFLLSPSSLKMLSGYPVDNVPAANQGRMHATPPASVIFSRVAGTTTVPTTVNYPAGSPFRLYTTSQVRSTGGNSGGPLCVQFEGGAWYPAGIFLGGSGQTVVRAIDSQVIDLFNRAEVSGNGGANDTSGGIIQGDAVPVGPAFSPASIKVDLRPAAAVNGGAKWRLGLSSTTLYGDGTDGLGEQVNNLTPATYTLYFSDVAGYAKPPPTAVTLIGGQLLPIIATYGVDDAITDHPNNKLISALDNVNFSVAVSGTPTAYRWQRNGVDLINGANANGTTVSGAGSATLTLSNIKSADAGNYTCRVTWASGPKTSNPGVLTVTKIAQALTFPVLANRYLAEGSFEVTALAGSELPVTFQVLAGGPATLSAVTETPTGSRVTVTPNGFGTVTVRANQAGDGDYNPVTKDRSFTVSGDTLDSWRARSFTASQLADTLLSGPLADLERDGVSTLLEFALNSNPQVPDRSTMIAGTGTRGLPLYGRESVAPFRATVEYVRRRAASAPGITYQIEFTTSLNPANWIITGTEVVTTIDATWERVKVTDSAASPATRYGRLKVTMP